MERVLENIVPDAGILNNKENPAIDSDRVKASVVDAGSTYVGGSQKHDVANQAGAARVVRLALTASQKTSDEERGDNQASAVQGGSGETGSGGSRDLDQTRIRNTDQDRTNGRGYRASNSSTRRQEENDRE